GGAESTLKTLREVQSLQHWFQLHRNVDLDPALQAPPEFIANSVPTADCQGQWVLAQVAADGSRYTIQIGADGRKHEFKTRQEH
ncbi:MAG: hypothetical protein ACOVRM_11700, partial [Planctomycetaceae bacterium]